MGQQEEEVQSNHNALNLLERHVVANAIPTEHRGGQCVNYYRCYGAQSLAAGGAMHVSDLEYKWNGFIIEMQFYKKHFFGGLAGLAGWWAGRAASLRSHISDLEQIWNGFLIEMQFYKKHFFGREREDAAH